jgi:hypothetical protein
MAKAVRKRERESEKEKVVSKRENTSSLDMWMAGRALTQSALLGVWSVVPCRVYLLPSNYSLRFASSAIAIKMIIGIIFWTGAASASTVSGELDPLLLLP